MSSLDILENCAIIILAAGKSGRLGSPKQLVRFQDKTLIQHAIDTALATQMKPIIVVLGAYAQKIKTIIADKKVHIVENSDWESGLSTSVKCGLKELITTYPLKKSVIFMVCDQPFVSSDILIGLLTTQVQSGMPIVACNYQGINGTPALFTDSMFEALTTLTGDMGAGKLIRQNQDNTALFPFPEGIIDIDTKEDFRHL